MTNPINLEETYNELSKLLKDLCSFLNTEVQNGSLSSDASNQAQKLLQRIQKQEDVVSKIAAIQESTNSNYPYLQMQRPAIVEEPLSIYVDTDNMNEIEEEIYELAENDDDSFICQRHTSMIFEDLCPYLDLTLSKLSEKAIKYGPLLRKERYFIIEQKKQLIVGLVGCWLLIYNANKKDTKPFQVVNMSEYRAQIKKEPVFEIVSDDKKAYEFIAKSAKDMDQWIVAINCKINRKSNTRNLPDVPTIEISKDNMKDDFNNSDSSIRNYSESEIYENIDEIRKQESTIAPADEDIDQDAPKLPERKTNYATKIELSTYNNMPTNFTNISSNSVSEDYESDTYDPVQNDIMEEEDIYDELKTVDTIDSQNMQIKDPPKINEKSFVPLSVHDNDNEDEDDCYDIPRSISTNDMSKCSPTNNNIEFEDEDVEYDELKIVSQNDNDPPIQCNEPDLKKTAKKFTFKPIIMSPKPKLLGGSKSENIQEDKNPTRIFSIIQQMEASSLFNRKN